MHKFTVLLDTAHLQHPLRFWFSIKPTNEKAFFNALRLNYHVNTAYRTHRGFLIEVISRDLEQLHTIQTQLELIGQTERISVLSCLCEEKFIANLKMTPAMTDAIVNKAI